MAHSLHGPVHRLIVEEEEERGNKEAGKVVGGAKSITFLMPSCTVNRTVL